MPQQRINGHAMYYEVHGDGDPLLLMTGWGTFCHGEERHVPAGLVDRYRVILFDHRGIGQSDDDAALVPSTDLYADDALALLAHLGVERAHIVGLIGMGACIAQKIAIKRPPLVRSMINTGCWLACDRFLHDQLDLLRRSHEQQGFLGFQRLVAAMSFEPAYYNKNIDRLLGPQGVWSDLNGRYEAHARFVQACLTHDVRDAIAAVRAPTLVAHAALDQVTGPRTTMPVQHSIATAEGALLEEAAHVIAGRAMKEKFAAILLEFLARH